MITQIKVYSRNVYGVSKNYPACDQAQRFAKLIGVKTLSREQLVQIGALGFQVEYVPDPKAQFDAIMDRAVVSHQAEIARAEWERS
ncbi:MAG TPA: hypothetical protein VGG49_13245 [Steroidobacteraceae bacterium]|jgi:hypothetical protein